jgi:sulfur carrier protein ThiS
MITISFRTFARLPNPPPGFKLGHRLELTVAEGTTLAQLIEQVLSIPPELVALIAVNRQVAEQDYVLQTQDRVDLFPPMVGG